MFFSISFEAERLCLKDLSQLVTGELNQRLKADATAMEKVSRFFGLKGDPFSFSFLPIEHFFPDTTVSVLKECFEALRLYDLAEILEKVKPRTLCPALSPEQVEKLQLDDRRTKSYSNMAVVVVDFCSEKGTAKMIETIFKDLNPKNEVCEVQFPYLKEKYLVQENIKRKEQLERYIADEKDFRYLLEIQIPEMKEKIGEGQEMIISPEVESLMKIGDLWLRGRGGRRIYQKRLRPKVISTTDLENKEIFLRKQLESKMKEITRLKEEIKRGTERIEDFERENSDAKSVLSNVMDKWIQDQG